MRSAIAALLALSFAFSANAGLLFDNGIFDRGDKKKETSVKAPFQSFQYDKKAEWDRYKKICVENVDVSALTPVAPQTAAGVSELAAAMKDSFRNETSSRAGKTWTLTESPDDETAVLKLSITRLTNASADGKQAAEISFEGKLVDKKTGGTVMRFSETKPYNPAASPWYGNCKDIIKVWADSFAEMSMPDAEKSEEHSRLRKVARMMGMHFGIRKFMD